jgi:alkyl sulfatase BDS1-like metallo-beta-lactamase superfamily hydrolase
MITNDLFEEFPNFIDFIVKIEEKKSEEKNIERQIKFIEEQQKLEIEFREKQLQHENKFRQEQERREVERKKKDRELAYIMSTNETPSAEGWKRLFSEE